MTKKEWFAVEWVSGNRNTSIGVSLDTSLDNAQD